MAGKGAMKAKCQAYRTNRRRERNIVRKIEKHLVKHPNDSQSKIVLETTRKFLKAG